jgi:hypothetical protein
MLIEKFSIITDSPQPISTHPYRTPFSIRNELRSILDQFLENKIIEPCSSPWNSPSLLVRKKDGRFRLVIDYRRLNDATLQMHHPLPNLEDSISYLAKSRVLGSLTSTGVKYNFTAARDCAEDGRLLMSKAAPQSACSPFDSTAINERLSCAAFHGTSEMFDHCFPSFAKNEEKSAFIGFSSENTMISTV